MKRSGLHNGSVPPSWTTGPVDPPETDEPLPLDSMGNRTGHRWVSTGAPDDDQPWCDNCGISIDDSGWNLPC